MAIATRETLAITGLEILLLVIYSTDIVTNELKRLMPAKIFLGALSGAFSQE